MQDAFVIAWRGLPKLLEPKAFAAWLRGIVRRQALHALRARRLESLAEAGNVPDERLSAEHSMEAGRLREQAFAALAGHCPRIFPHASVAHHPGSFVRRDDTVASCAAILDSAHDDVPEEAFRFTGGIDQVLARARGAR